MKLNHTSFKVGDKILLTREWNGIPKGSIRTIKFYRRTLDLYIPRENDEDPEGYYLIYIDDAFKLINPIKNILPLP